MSEAVLSGPFFGWLTDMLKSIAEIRTPFLDKVMNGVSVLGNEMAFIVIGLILLWCVNKKLGYRFMLVFIAGNVVNQFLKALFMIPRPWVLDPEVKPVPSALDDATGFSFPSGHTQSATIMYGLPACRIRKAWAYIAAAALIAAVGFSRMYLGVHTLLDVVCALIAGVIVIAVMELIFAKCGDGKKVYSVVSGITALAALGLVIFVMTYCVKKEYDPTQVKDVCVVFGTACGLFAGSFVEQRFVDFDERAKWWVQIIKVVVGLALVLGLRMGLKPLLAGISDSPFMDIARYFIMSFFAIAVYPLFFKLFRKRGSAAE